MKTITAKKLLASALISFVLGFGTLAVIKLKTASTSCHPNGCPVLDFLHQWVAPVGMFLVVLSVVLIIAAIILRLSSPKPGIPEKTIVQRQTVISCALLIIGSLIFLLSQWKLSSLSSYYDRDDVALYGSLISPFGGLLFLLGFVMLYILVLKSKRATTK
jgi:hypothetical protein